LRKKRRRFIDELCVVVAVKDVVLKLKPLLTKNKLLVSVAAGIKLKDLQVTVYLIIFLLHFCI
jgi:pyrroline-5-carboxylate reductase